MVKELLQRNLVDEVRIIPQSLDLEMAVLGAILLDQNALDQVKDFLKPELFHKKEHTLIFENIMELQAASEAVDLLSLTRLLRKKGLSEATGGASYLPKLLGKVNSAANVEHHARLVVQTALKRLMIDTSREVISKCKEEQKDVFELLTDTEQAFFKISEHSIRKQYSSAHDILKSTINELEKKKIENVDGITGIPSGFTQLDELTGGWQNTELSILAARPGMGKTAFVVTTMRNAAVDNGTPVAIFSLEMSATQLMMRMISSEAEIDSSKLRKGTLEPHEWQQMHFKLKQLSKAKIYIDDTPALSILELRAKCRRLKAQFDIGMVIIDYLQLMSGDDGTGVAGNREQEIATISRSLKNLAKEINVPVIALSQLSRAVEIRGGDKRPQLSDLRESGSIEQDADLVLFLYRPDYYGITEDENNVPYDGLSELIVAKNRAGTLENIRIRFLKEYTKFVNPNQHARKNEISNMPGADGNYSHFEKSSDFVPTFKSKANNNPDQEISF